MKQYFRNLIFLGLLLQSVGVSAQINRAAGKSSIAYRNNYQRVSAGLSHTLEIRNGQLWAWGNNKYGQLGDSTKVGKISPVKVGSDEDWVTVSAGRDHSMAIKANGTLWGWGRNAYGELGIGNTNQVLYPTQVGSEQSWTSVSCNHANHTIALKADGTLWAWGYNLNGQLGDSTTNNKINPTQIGKDRLWVVIATGYQHSTGIKSDGSLWAWGLNSAGQLGDTGTVRRIKPIQIDSVTSVLNGWVSVSCGFTHTMGLKADGSLWAWGGNSFGQLGDSTIVNKLNPVLISYTRDFVSIAAGGNHSMALKANGTLWIWGLGSKGQMANGSTANIWIPTKIEDENPLKPRWVMMSAGYDHCMAVKADGTLMAWGRNDIGQIGDSTYVNKFEPLLISNVVNWVSFSAGVNYTIALKSDGTLWAWGNNTYGQLGDGTNTRRMLPVPVGADNDWISIVCGEYHNLALKSDGTLWAWGFGNFGPIGDGFTLNRKSPVKIGTDSNWTNIAAGSSHSLALKSDGSLWAWGFNAYGQLGLDSRKNWSRPVEMQSDSFWISIACGNLHSHGVKADGRLWSWGNNSIDQLGVAKLDEYATYPRRLDLGYNTVAISSKGYFGKFRNAYGEIRYIDTSTKIDNKNNWIALASGINYSLLLDAAGNISGMGNNNYGQLGDGSISDKGSPTTISGQTSVVFVNAGYNHSGIIKADRNTLCMTGLNILGQLGTGDTLGKFVFDCKRKADQNITTAELETLVMCSGNKIIVPFAAIGSYDTSNIFRAELSNNMGQFENPVVIGSIKSNHSDTIQCLIPFDVVSGTAYRIRVMSTSPEVTGTNNGVDLKIFALIKPVISTEDNTTFCFGNKVTLNATTSLGASLLWIRNYEEISGTTGISYTTKLSGIYYLIVQLEGVCKDSSNKITVTVNPFPVITTNPANQIIKSGQKAKFVAAVLDKTAKLQWQQDAGLDYMNLTDGGIYKGVNSDTLIIDTASFAMNNFHYRCVATTLQGCSSVSNEAILTVEEFLSIAGMTLKRGITVYPNPANDQITLKTRLSDLGFEYFISDIVGKTVLTGFVENELTTLNIEHLSKGLYILKIKGDEGNGIKIIKF